MAEAREPLFLERETYRRRRLMDAARFMPFFGAALFLAPALWGGVSSTAAGLLYLFGVWVVLIAIAALVARRLGRGRGDEATRGPGAGG